MTSTLTSKEVTSHITQLLPTAVTEHSALSQVGATNINYGVDEIRTINLGAPALLKESEKKPLADMKIDEHEVHKVKLVYGLIVSEESEKYDDYEAYKADMIAKSIEGIVKSSDIAILNGTNPQTGEVRPDLKDVNLSDNAKQAVSTGDIDRDLDEIVANTKKVTGIILSDSGYSQLSLYRNRDGVKIYAGNASETAPFTGGAGKLNYKSPGFGVNGWSATEDFDNNNLAVAGNWASIGRYFSDIKVKQNTEGTFGGRELWTYNEIGFLIEMHIGFVIPDPAKFTVLKSADSE